MPEARRSRIRRLLGVLDSQPFFALPDADAARAAGNVAYGYRVRQLRDGAGRLRERMPRLVELAPAIAIAELEIDGQYDPARHDALFEPFGANGLDPQELRPLPRLSRLRRRRAARRRPSTPG